MSCIAQVQKPFLNKETYNIRIQLILVSGQNQSVVTSVSMMSISPWITTFDFQEQKLLFLGVLYSRQNIRHILCKTIFWVSMDMSGTNVFWSVASLEYTLGKGDFFRSYFKKLKITKQSCRNTEWFIKWQRLRTYFWTKSSLGIVILCFLCSKFSSFSPPSLCWLFFLDTCQTWQI